MTKGKKGKEEEEEEEAKEEEEDPDFCPMFEDVDMYIGDHYANLAALTFDGVKFVPSNKKLLPDEFIRIPLQFGKEEDEKKQDNESQFAVSAESDLALNYQSEMLTCQMLESTGVLDEICPCSGDEVAASSLPKSLFEENSLETIPVFTDGSHVQKLSCTFDGEFWEQSGCMATAHAYCEAYLGIVSSEIGGVIEGTQAPEQEEGVEILGGSSCMRGCQFVVNRCCGRRVQDCNKPGADCQQPLFLQKEIRVEVCDCQEQQLKQLKEEAVINNNNVNNNNNNNIIIISGSDP